MLKKIKKWVTGKGGSSQVTPQPDVKPDIIPRKQHGISRNEISENALKVLYRLKKNGFQAYLVGGGVRDLLLGFHPKDFDIATNAKPEDIRDIFNNCRLIGRRFRLAHIYFGRDIVEVATFRGKAPVEQEAHTSDKGMILRDNVYGDINEDVWRRDFTMNALYYNIKDFSLVDYCGGLKDIKKGILRIIGDPETRFVEDPVRMLRAIRLSCKLNLKLAKDIPPAIKKLNELISHVPQARLYEETLKLFHSGAAVKTYEALITHGLFYKLFPTLEKLSEPEKAKAFILRVLANTDKRLGEGKSVNPAFIFAAFLWYPLQEQVQALEKTGIGNFPATLQGSDLVLQAQRKRITMPKRFALIAKDIWLMQIRLERKQARRIEKLSRDPRFRAAYDFLLLRGDVGECKDTADWWYHYVEGDNQTRKQALKSLGQSPKKRKRKNKNKQKRVDHDIME